MHDALRKAGTRVLLHIPVSRVRLAELRRLHSGLLIGSTDREVFAIIGINRD
jgi:hypothetical protein